MADVVRAGVTAAVNASLAPPPMTTTTTAMTTTTTMNETTPFDASCFFMTSSDGYIITSLRVYFGTSMILFVVGLVGNGLSIAVFSSREMRTMSSNVYLLALATSDSLYLVSVFFNRLLTTARCWYFPSLPVDVVNRSHFFCVALQYFNDLFSDYSTCLILAFTVERGLAVFKPIAFKERCTVARARLACALMFVAIGASIAPYHAIMISLNVDYHVCTILIEHEQAFSAIYLAETMALRVLPVVAIAFLNGFIIARVTTMTQKKNRRRRQSALQARRVATGGGGAETPYGGADVYQLMPEGGTGGNGNGKGASGGSCGVVHQLHRIRRQKRRISLDERNLQLTIILILVSTTYILSYLPALIYFFMSYLRKAELITWVSWEALDTFGNYAKALHISGFAINFFLYTVSGRVFRDQLVWIVCRRRCVGVPAAGSYAHPGAPVGGTSSTNVEASAL